MNTRLRRLPPTSSALCDSQEQRLGLLQEQFIRHISHELRTSLTVVLGSLELLKDQKGYLDSDTRAALLDQAIDECDQLWFLIKSILALLELGKSANSPKSEWSPIKEEVHVE